VRIRGMALSARRRRVLLAVPHVRCVTNLGQLLSKTLRWMVIGTVPTVPRRTFSQAQATRHVTSALGIGF
jgi:hypothetical protein